MYYNDGTDYTRGARAIAAAGHDGRTPWIRKRVGRNVVVELQPQVSRRRYASMVNSLGDEAMSPTQQLPTSSGLMYPPPPGMIAPVVDVLMPTNPGVLYPPSPDSRPPAFVGPTSATQPGGAGIQIATPHPPTAPAAGGGSGAGLAVVGALVAAALLAFS